MLGGIQDRRRGDAAYFDIVDADEVHQTPPKDGQAHREHEVHTGDEEDMPFLRGYDSQKERSGMVRRADLHNVEVGAIEIT